MKILIPLALFLLAIFQTCVAPPVTKNKEKEKDKENDEMGGLEDYMEYHRYLREVVNALESDPEFRQKLEKADEQDIRSGKIAEELEFVSHGVRGRLDEIKRVELHRLRTLTEKKRRLQKNIDLEDPTHRHLDHSNPHTFEINDLKKLIERTTADLVEADRKRREEFKEYELQKEYEKQMKINSTDGEEKEKIEKQYHEREEKHKQHKPLHEPGHKAQLEEVWQEQDQMQQEFDPKTFFMLHDIDSNGLWDQDEVKALFVKELEKMYAAGEPEDDMRERAEEMERMRESVFKEVDLNQDGFIDYEEFLAQTKRNDFQQDHGWQGIDERKPYTDQELEQYIRQHQVANQYGYPQPYQGYQQPPPGHHPNMGPGPGHPNGMPMHPNAVPQQQFHPGQLPPQHPQQLQGHLNTNEVYPQHKQQLPNQSPQAYHQQQVDAYHQQQAQAYHQQQPPQQGQYQQHPQPPPPQHHQQPPPQAAQHQQQPPQAAQHQQQPPQAAQHQQQPPQAAQHQQTQQQQVPVEQQPQPNHENPQKPESPDSNKV